MLRESTAANSMHVMVVVTPVNGVAFQYRSTAGEESFNIGVGGVTAPQWVRIDREGDTFIGYYSDDGADWIEIGHTSIQMANIIQAGLAVTSHNAGESAEAVISEVQIIGQ